MHEPCHFYLLPIGGTATAALAGLLHESGERVTGVDSALYPPTSDLLADLGVPVRLGYDPAAIPADLDTVVIGNALPRTNAEVQAVLERGLPYVSQAACLGERFCAPARSIVVAGTHGKTTTSSLVAHLLISGGFDPTVAVGGQPIGGRPWRLGRGGWTVVEGDEYNTAFFDRGPKFLHYHPHLFVVGNVEFDHGDLYPDLDAILAAFRAGVARIDPEGRVVANLGDGGARAVAEGHPRVLWYGLAEGAELRCTVWTHRGGRLHATLAWRGASFDVDVPLVGRHNLDDVMAASACALEAGMAPADVASALATFPGVRRRLEVVGEEGGVVVVDDFAHHPTAVRLTLEGARHRFPGRRLVVAFEPRSLTAGRALFFDAYVEAFVKADLALVAPVFHRARLAPEVALDRETLAAAVGARGGNAIALPLDRPVVDVVAEHLHPGDVILCMSSGDFGRLTRTLMARLAERP